MPKNKGKSVKKAAASNTVQHDGLPIAVTDEEWNDYKEDFPDLTRANAYITSPECYDSYNCIGWSVGDTNLEYDVGPLTEMVEFYRGKGYVEVKAGSEDADIDLMSANGYLATHATKRYTGTRIDGMPAGLWESKLYPGARMTHGRYEVACETYGKVVKSFRKA